MALDSAKIPIFALAMNNSDLFLWLLLACVFTACGGNSQSTDAESATPPAEDTASQPATVNDNPVILIFGNSLTAGYGLASVEDAFPSLIQQRIDSLGLNYTVVNAGLSGETTTGGKNRLGWLLKQEVDILVIELGANDGLRGIDPDETLANLAAMIDMARDKYPEIQVILCGMMAPPNMGQDFTSRFQRVFLEVAEEKEVALVPFLLDGVAGEPALNQPDRIHPTPEGHKILAENLWQILRTLVESND